MRPSTSWEEVHAWYDKHVGKEGHYYHQHIIFPSVLRLLGPMKSILDVGCGQGVFSQKISSKVNYVGLDLSPSLIGCAQKTYRSPHVQFIVHDVCNPLPSTLPMFSHAIAILSLQNMRDPALVFRNVGSHLEKDGLFLFVLNHPCFRIPRQSSWSIDPVKKIQSRKIDRYMTPLEIPIQANPSQKESSAQSMSFHYPLSYYSQKLFASGFVIEQIEEWCSDKQSTGSSAKMENRARVEFPLFLAVIARKRDVCYEIKKK